MACSARIYIPWSQQEEDNLLCLLLERRHWDDESARPLFSTSIWEDIANSLPHEKVGIRRTPHSCKRKWTYLKQCWNAVPEIRQRFGWDDELGANIEENADDWEAFLSERGCKSRDKYRAVVPFRNKGWASLDKVARIFEPPRDESQKGNISRTHRRNLIPEVVIIRRPEHDWMRHYLKSSAAKALSNASSSTDSPVFKFKFKKEEPDVEISLFTPPPPDVQDEPPEHEPLDDRDTSLVLLPQTPKRKAADPEPMDVPPAKRPCLSPDLEDQRIDVVNTPVSSDDHTADPTVAELSIRESRIEAVRRVQALETYLSDPGIVALIDLFEAKPEAADIYLSLTRESVRKQWVANRVKHLNDV